jgi:hypothetical protein
MLESNTIVLFTTTSLNPLIGIGDHRHTNKVDLIRLRAKLALQPGAMNVGVCHLSSTCIERRSRSFSLEA